MPPQYDFKVYLTRDMKDKLTPVIISIDFALAEGETEMEHLSNQPVIRINGDKHVTKSINIKNNCRLHNFCDDNLKGWFQSFIHFIILDVSRIKFVTNNRLIIQSYFILMERNGSHWLLIRRLVRTQNHASSGRRV